jgi:hypothetical protein
MGCTQDTVKTKQINYLIKALHLFNGFVHKMRKVFPKTAANTIADKFT